MLPEPGREVAHELLRGVVDGCVAAPAQTLGSEQHLLGAHRVDDVGMGGHPDSGLGGLAEQGVELAAGGAVLDRVHPDQQAIQRQQLGANILDRVVGIHDRFRVDV